MIIVSNPNPFPGRLGVSPVGVDMVVEERI